MQEKEDLIEEIESILGLIPANTRLLLNLLVQPSLVDYTRRYIRAADKSFLCKKYEAPWSCLKEAEAKFENVKFGWLGAGGEFELDWICESCRQRIIEE